MSATSIKHGVYGGLAGGVVFGAMMAMARSSTRPPRRIKRQPAVTFG